jgi:Prokaryotic acetaldehyde dehydrogenase, dimerisation
VIPTLSACRGHGRRLPDHLGPLRGDRRLGRPSQRRPRHLCAISPDADRSAITSSIHEMVAAVQEYVPGYPLRAEPQFDDPQRGWDGPDGHRPT